MEMKTKTMIKPRGGPIKDDTRGTVPTFDFF